MEEAQERYNECLEVMLKAWTTPGRFSHHGKRWHFKDIVVEPAPRQQPHPPIWMAAGTPGGIAYVASQNYGICCSTSSRPWTRWKSACASTWRGWPRRASPRDRA